jgi:7-cyano-7-deazaguanine synthase
MVAEGSTKDQTTAVLLSGGLDSAVLAAAEAVKTPVQPIYVSVGLAWEEAERRMLERLLSHRAFADRVQPLASLAFQMTDVYPPTHWAIRGTPPAYDTPDEDVYLTGRNVVLLSKAGVFCGQRALRRIVIGPLAGNPFPDATPAFFSAMSSALSLGLAHPIEVAAPFASLHKSDVIKLGVELGVPLELTLSCMNPVIGNDGPRAIARHCGLCSKCRERRDAFEEAGVEDPTEYAAASPRGAEGGGASGSAGL